VVGDIAQAIFTFEVAVKLIAERTPEAYFTDRENGSWNILDFIIVTIGYEGTIFALVWCGSCPHVCSFLALPRFVEMTPLAFIFQLFPVVTLRLLRLLRVFRLAKALPRLRSIVEALFSGFSSVGWICVLILVYQYISGTRSAMSRFVI
jgi:voltage-gated sodium channel